MVHQRRSLLQAGCPPVASSCDSEDDCEDQAEVWDADASDLDAAGTPYLPWSAPSFGTRAVARVC